MSDQKVIDASKTKGELGKIHPSSRFCISDVFYNIVMDVCGLYGGYIPISVMYLIDWIA